MKMSYRWLAIVSMFVMGYTMAACELQETCDPDVDQNCIVDAGSDATSETGDETQQYQSFFYVMVWDHDAHPSGDTPGADIQAIELVKGGDSYYIGHVEDGSFGSHPPEATADNADFRNIIGPPEGGCNVNDPPLDTLVSLGGEGGFVVGSFTGMEPVETGNTITVHTCHGDESETWDASVGVGTDPFGGTWREVILGGIGTTSGTVPTLPQIPLN